MLSVKSAFVAEGRKSVNSNAFAAVLVMAVANVLARSKVIGAAVFLCKQNLLGRVCVFPIPQTGNVRFLKRQKEESLHVNNFGHIGGCCCLGWTDVHGVATEP